MHSLEVIIARNEAAAGRELGHARNDGQPSTIAPPNTHEGYGPFIAAYRRAITEG
jgi:hypothetical protein